MPVSLKTIYKQNRKLLTVHYQNKNLRKIVSITISLVNVSKRAGSDP